MNTSELIGKVGASYLQEKLSRDNDTGTARYLIDCLTAEQTAAIARTISKDYYLSEQVEIKLPTHFIGNLLSEEFLTNERTTYFRNAACNKSALLIANTGDDEEQSLKDLEPIGCKYSVNYVPPPFF